MSNSAGHKARRRARTKAKARAGRLGRNLFLGIRLSSTENDAYRRAVDRMTNRERRAWNRERNPGKRERAVEPLRNFTRQR